MEDEIKKLEEIKRLEKFRKVEKKLEERREEVLSASPIRINVSGTIFTTSLKTLLADPFSLLFVRRILSPIVQLNAGFDTFFRVDDKNHIQANENSREKPRPPNTWNTEFPRVF